MWIKEKSMRWLNQRVRFVLSNKKYSKRGDSVFKEIFGGWGLGCTGVSVTCEEGSVGK